MNRLYLVTYWRNGLQYKWRWEANNIFLNGNKRGFGITLKSPLYYCNKCERKIKNLNKVEQEELKGEGSFICSDCINKEMVKELEKLDSELNF